MSDAKHLTDRAAAWAELKRLAPGVDDNALHLAAFKYVRASEPPKADVTRGQKTTEVRGTRGNTLRSGHVMPFGRGKNLPIEEAETKDLVWMSGVLREGLDDPSKERFRETNQALLTAIEAEISTR
jgi:hypothetical protein